MNNAHFAIPEIYGETLSYYELLRKLVDKTNELIENYNTVPEQIAEAVANLDASQLFSEVLNELINSIATDNTKSTNAVKVYKKHDLLYATFNDTVNLYESLIDFTTGTETELIVGSNIREVNISELFIELRKLIEDETQSRGQADTALQTNIDNEAQSRTQADTALQTNIDNEAQSRTQADTALQTNIDNEAQERRQADTALQRTIDSGTVKLDLLWNNVSPSSSFAPQTIDANINEYKLLLIVFRMWATDDRSATYIADKVTKYNSFLGCLNYIVNRNFTINSNGINFEGAKWKYTNESSWTDNDTGAVPVRIYGVK